MTPRPATCAIHQPNLFPRLGTLHKITEADIWIVLDDVQFNRRDYQHRARLAHLADETQQQWLSLTIRRPSGRASLINEVVVLDQETNARRITRLVEQYYRRAPHWELVRDVTTEVAAAVRTTTHLAAVAELSTQLLLDLLGWRGSTIHSSTLPARSERSTRLADLTRQVGATEYLCGPGGARYLDDQPFAEQGIAVRYITASHAARWQRPVTALRQLAMTGSSGVLAEPSPVLG